MSIAETLKRVQMEEELHNLRIANSGLCQLLAGALCTICGEPFEDAMLAEQKADGYTAHVDCEIPLAEVRVNGVRGHDAECPLHEIDPDDCAYDRTQCTCGYDAEEE